MKSRLYSLYAYRASRWERISDLALLKPKAVAYWQNALLAPILGTVPYERRELRPVTR